MRKTTLIWSLLFAGGLARIVYAQAMGNTATPAPTPQSTPAATEVLTGQLDLATAQQEAIEHSPSYQKALNYEKETSWGQVEAFSEGFLPHISISGKYFMANQYANENVALSAVPPINYISFDENFPIANLTLDAEYDLFDGFRNIHKLDAANNSHEAASLLSHWASFQLQEQVRLAFYKAQAAKELSDMADQNVKTLEDHLRIVNDQMDNGQATKYDVLRVEVQLSEAKSDQISYHDNVILARERLSQSMGLAKDDRTLSGDMPVLDADAILSGMSKVDFENRPDLKAKDLMAKAAGDQSAAADSFWVPKVSLIGEYQWYNLQDYAFGGNPTNTGTINDSYFVGAAATWDLLDGGISWAKSNEAHERAHEAQDDLNSAQLQAPYDFDYWKKSLVSKVALYQAKLTDIDKAKESARLATLGFKAGTRTTTDVLDAELEEFRAAAGLVQAQVDALEALINLEITVGKRINHD
jgi:outer membrane protein TolC